MKFMKKNNKKRKGFTLVELVVVVAIIAILAMIAVPRFMEMTEGSKVSTLEANHKIIVSAISQFAANNGGALPTNAEQEDILKYISDVPEGTATVDEYFDNRPAGATYVYEDGVLTSTLTDLKNKYEGRVGVTSGDEAPYTYTITFTP